MKKIVFITTLILLSTIVYAESESWMSLGFESGYFFEHGSDSEDTIDSYMGTSKNPVGF